jgi:histidinol phosphatase-like PHP family hydrolase
MFIIEATYDIDELLRYNFHIHTTFSGCAKPDMILKDIVAEAERCGLEIIALTDHSNLGDNLRVVSENTPLLREQLAAVETDVKVLIGSEISAYAVGKYSETKEFCETLDYRLYSQNHYHLSFWEQPEDKSPRGYAVHMLAVLEELFKSGRADCVAHPFSGGYIRTLSEEEKLKVPDCITDNELGDILEKGERAGCAWEINAGEFCFLSKFSKRYWDIGREVGVHFNFGTDGHTLKNVDTRGFAGVIKDIIK